MTKDEALFDVTCQPMLNWQQRIEAITGIKCVNMRSVLEGEFSVSKLRKAQREDMCYFKDLATEIMELCEH